MDWRTKDGGVLNEVEDQGTCNAGYAFAATSMFESHLKLIGEFNLPHFSKQQIIDCSTDN